VVIIQLRKVSTRRRFTWTMLRNDGHLFTIYDKCMQGCFGWFYEFTFTLLNSICDLLGVNTSEILSLDQHAWHVVTWYIPYQRLSSCDAGIRLTLATKSFLWSTILVLWQEHNIFYHFFVMLRRPDVLCSASCMLVSL